MLFGVEFVRVFCFKEFFVFREGQPDKLFRERTIAHSRGIQTKTEHSSTVHESRDLPFCVAIFRLLLPKASKRLEIKNIKDSFSPPRFSETVTKSVPEATENAFKFDELFGIRAEKEKNNN